MCLWYQKLETWDIFGSRPVCSRSALYSEPLIGSGPVCSRERTPGPLISKSCDQNREQTGPLPHVIAKLTDQIDQMCHKSLYSCFVGYWHLEQEDWFVLEKFSPKTECFSSCRESFKISCLHPKMRPRNQSPTQGDYIPGFLINPRYYEVRAIPRKN